MQLYSVYTHAYTLYMWHDLYSHHPPISASFSRVIALAPIFSRFSARYVSLVTCTATQQHKVQNQSRQQAGQMKESFTFLTTQVGKITVYKFIFVLGSISQQLLPKDVILHRFPVSMHWFLNQRKLESDPEVGVLPSLIPQSELGMVHTLCNRYTHSVAGCAMN